MAEYISKQRAKDLMGCCLASTKAEYKAAKDEFTKARFGDYISSIQSMIDVVGSVEAADVQPVKRGRWIYKGTVNSWDEMACSCCDGAFSTQDREQILDWEFCPHCGARMDGEQNDD